MSATHLPTPLDAATWTTADWPLGAHADASSTTFAVAAPAATRVLLELYAAATGADALTEVDLARGTDGVWRGRLGAVGHGALYHAIGSDPGQAEAVVSAVVASGVPVVLGAPGALWLELARAAGLRTVLEGFPDRGYAAEGTLVPRSRPGALVSDPQVIAERAVEMATTGTVVAEDGSTVHLAPGSLCVHGDSPGAVATARAVRAALEAAGVAPAAFASA